MGYGSNEFNVQSPTALNGLPMWSRWYAMSRSSYPSAIPTSA
jgi:hypothetical protein